MILKKDRDNVYTRKLASALPYWYFTVAIVVMLRKAEHSLYYIIGGVLVIVFCTAGVYAETLIRHWRVKGYTNKLLAEEETRSGTTNIGHYVYNYLGSLGHKILFYGFFAILFSYLAGYADALTMKNYLIIDSTDKVVLRIHDDKAIVAKYDPKTKVVYRIIFSNGCKPIRYDL